MIIKGEIYFINNLFYYQKTYCIILFYFEICQSSLQRICTSNVSATELMTMRAEIWKSNLQLSESEMCAKNMEEIVIQTVEEKYDLLDELNRSLMKTNQLSNQLSNERYYL